ncbi:MAG: hypothetical protein B7Z57_14445, partial [Acidiphilium sp. 37-60-79]
RWWHFGGGVWRSGLRAAGRHGGAGGEAAADAIDSVPDHSEQATEQADIIAIGSDGAEKLAHDAREADDLG